MKRTTSLQTTILSTVAVSLAFLAIFLVFGITSNEIAKNEENTKQLVFEQIDLIVKKLDNYAVIGQIEAISKTVFDLNRVDGLVIYDVNCSELRKQPLNLQISWDCKDAITNKNLLLYEVSNSFSQSKGAPRFIIAQVKLDDWSLLNVNNLVLGLVTLFSIFGTVVGLTWLMRWKILSPLKNLKRLVSQSGRIGNIDLNKFELPQELIPIYESVLQRDEIIQQAKIELLAQSKSQAIAELSKQVAHDIKFPLMVLRDKLANSIDDKNFKLYEQSLIELEEITGQLLEKSFDHTQELDINELISSVVERKRLEFKSTNSLIEISFTKSIEELKVLGNGTQVKSVLSNLFNNAKEAIGFGKSGKILISSNQNDSEVLISIKDNGCGVKPSDLERIFDRGVSVKKPGGLGLGLSNAKDVIEQMKGSIELQSDGVSGTTISIRLPLLQKSIQSTGKAPYDFVLIEDYKLSQMLWLETAKEKNLNFALFTSPKDFLNNKALVKPEAEIFIDSQFPDFDGCGVVWSECLAKEGFKNMWACSTNEFDVTNMPWLKGYVKKTEPFSIFKDSI